MTINERNEVREMIQGVLNSFYKDTETREKLINISLNNIDSHLGKINGKLLEHSNIIAANLPHTILHCSQSKNIEEIKSVLSEKVTVNKTEKELKIERRAETQKILQLIATIIMLIGLGITSYISFRATKKIESTETNIKQEIKAQEGISKVTRSGYVKYNDSGLSDSIKVK